VVALFVWPLRVTLGRTPPAETLAPALATGVVWSDRSKFASCELPASDAVAVSTLAARSLAERLGGDRGAADWRHFGRLADLTNRKEKYRADEGRYPFVRLVEWAGSQYTARKAFLKEVFSMASRRTAPTATAPQFSESLTPRLSIDDFRNKREYGGDGNRIDLAYAVYALAHGVTDDEIRSAIASRDLSKKGPEPRQRAYVERTIRKACSTLGR
jgi:RepB DNA-primase from phage plasmid